MKKRLIAILAAVLLILTISLLLTNCFGAFSINPTPSPSATLSSAPTPTPTPLPTITVPDDFPTINSAIANAPSGYRILVKNGTYNEGNINITKPLTIVSQSQNGATIILKAPSKSIRWLMGWDYRCYDPINITANNVTLSGFSISSDTLGIIANGNGIKISSNNMTGLTGLTVEGSQSKIMNNAMNDLTLKGNKNKAENNLVGSIKVSGQLNIINKNYASQISIVGNNNTISSNYVNGTRAGIELKSANYNIVWNNTIEDTNVGILVGEYTTDDYNFFGGNTINNATESGIFIREGSHNVFYGNKIACCRIALALGWANILTNYPVENNLFLENTFMKNYQNIRNNFNDDSFVNVFDNGLVGNYWDKYSGKGSFRVYYDVFDHFPLLESPGVLTDFPSLPIPWSKISFTLSNNS